MSGFENDSDEIEVNPISQKLHKRYKERKKILEETEHADKVPECEVLHE